MAVLKGKWKVKDGKLVKGSGRKLSVSERLRQKGSKRVRVVKKGTTT